METLSLILHVTAAAALVGPQILLFLAVIPATRELSDDDRSAVTRSVTRRFGMIAGVSLVALLVTGLYQFYEVVPVAVQEEMNDFRFGPLFMAKMTLFLVLIALIAVHAAWLGPRIQAALDAGTAAEGARDALARLRRRSLWVSAAMVAVSLLVLALGVAMGHHEYAYLAR
ncbi:MAG: hypothetical protein F4150_07415 [Chloroflexi bacterium]|nr:hypothetical protein [Chloroflexota bacterium]